MVRPWLICPLGQRHLMWVQWAYLPCKSRLKALFRRFWVLGLGFRIWGLKALFRGFRVLGLGFRIWDLKALFRRFWVEGLGFGV
jgi:hypothetical protein